MNNRLNTHTTAQTMTNNEDENGGVLHMSSGESDSDRDDDINASDSDESDIDESEGSHNEGNSDSDASNTYSISSCSFDVDSKSEVLDRVKLCGEDLRYAAEELRGDKNIVMVAVKMMVLHCNTLLMS